MALRSQGLYPTNEAASVTGKLVREVFVVGEYAAAQAPDPATDSYYRNFWGGVWGGPFCKKGLPMNSEKILVIPVSTWNLTLQYCSANLLAVCAAA